MGRRLFVIVGTKKAIGIVVKCVQRMGRITTLKERLREAADVVTFD